MTGFALDCLGGAKYARSGRKLDDPGGVASIMRFRYGRLHWYDIVLVGLAAAVVYPDRILEWCSERTGRTLGWLHLILIELIAIGLLVLTMVLLLPRYPPLAWWHPLLYVGLLALIRLVMAGVTSFFGYDD